MTHSTITATYCCSRRSSRRIVKHTVGYLEFENESIYCYIFMKCFYLSSNTRKQKESQTLSHMFLVKALKTTNRQAYIPRRGDGAHKLPVTVYWFVAPRPDILIRVNIFQLEHAQVLLHSLLLLLQQCFPPNKILLQIEF